MIITRINKRKTTPGRENYMIKLLKTERVYPSEIMGNDF